jgi:hypothetical protein
MKTFGNADHIQKLIGVPFCQIGFAGTLCHTVRVPICRIEVTVALARDSEAMVVVLGTGKTAIARSDKHPNLGLPRKQGCLQQMKDMVSYARKESLCLSDEAPCWKNTKNLSILK